MKKNHHFNSQLFIIFLYAIFVTGCKKQIAINDIGITEMKEKIHKETVKNYGRNGAVVEIPVNMPATEIAYVNQERKRIELNTMKDAGSCNSFNCGNTNDPNDLFVQSQLEYIKWVYKCGTGNDMIATWRISVPFTLLLQHPGNSSYSFGQIEVEDGGGTQLAASGSLGNGNFKVVSLGTDPNCANNVSSPEIRPF